ncbi:16S rRNA (cytosine(1402)-N(4))-methyltransferase, partial [bacterium (Candidatus Howlettbacteria) CG23_combo_of_CG06-09_8_20_14_all_37_9]
MPYEVVKYLGPQPGDIIVDGTLGGGGHAGLILERILPKGILVGIDQDKEAIEAAEKKLSGFKKNTKVIQGNFKDIGKILTELKIDQVDGILLDLGISMHQILTPERGFGFYPSPENLKSPLDMRMNTETGITAADILNTWKERDLTELFFKLGDEKYSRSIAMQIVRRRPLETVGDLLEAIKAGTPPSYRAKSLKNKWAANVFRALRMEVNN